MSMGLVRPADLARWAFWVPFRSLVDPRTPAVLHAMRGGWRLQYSAAGEDRELMADEYRRWFGDTMTERGIARTVQDAYRKSWRVHLEELTLSKLTPDTVDQWVELRGADRLDTALEEGRGVILVYPHAGPVMLMIAALAHKGYRYVQYAARGLAPPEIAANNPDLLAHNPLREAVRTAREAHENSLNVEYLTEDAPVRTLHRRLADNQIVGLAFDGRIGSSWAPMPFLNRTALLSPGPWKLACSTGAVVLPVFGHTPDDGPACIEIGEPIPAQDDWTSTAAAALSQQERWLRQHPEEYGLWLLHTRLRSGIDDHPLFTDTAPANDQRYRRWMPDE